MRLNQEQLQQLANHLQHNFRSACTICGSTNWQFDDTIFEIRQFMGGGISTEGLIKPAVAVTCSGCGQIVLVNAIAAGVVRVVQDNQTAPEQTNVAAAQPAEEPVAETQAAEAPATTKSKSKKKS